MSHRLTSRAIHIVLGLTAGAGIAAGQGFRGAYQLDQWTTTGIEDGVTSIDAGDVMVFSYNADLPNSNAGVSFRTSEFSTLAAASGTFTVDWEYDGFHSFCCPATAVLQLFAETSNGRVTVDLVGPGTATSGDFSFAGQDASIQIEAARRFGIIVGGANGDSNAQLHGTVRLSRPRIVADGFRNDFHPANWWSDGIADGVTTLGPTSDPDPSLQFTYEVDLGNPGAGVSPRLGTFSVYVQHPGTIRFDWDYSGFHAFFAARATFQITIENNGQQTTIPLVSNVPVSGNFQFTGTTSISVQPGETVTFAVGGQNFDGDSRLLGTVLLSNFAYSGTGFIHFMAPHLWSSTGIADGITDIATPLDQPADIGLFNYDVNLGNPGPGVPFRTAEFTAVAEADGVVSFDWLFQGFHAFCCPSVGVLQLFADTSNGREVVDLVPSDTNTAGGHSLSGTNASIAVEAGMPFGIIVGGENNDANSVLRGIVALSSFSAPLAGDLDADGDVDLSDLSNMLSAFGTCDGDAAFLPAADVNDNGCVDLSDLSRLLSNFGI